MDDQRDIDFARYSRSDLVILFHRLSAYLIEPPNEVQFLLPDVTILKSTHFPCDPWAPENFPSKNQHGAEGTSSVQSLGQRLQQDVDTRDPPAVLSGTGAREAQSLPWKAPPCARPRGVHAEASALFIPSAASNGQMPHRDSHTCGHQCGYRGCEDRCCEQDISHKHHFCTRHILII